MDDFTLNVRQIAQYPPEPVAPTDLVLLQAGLGAPYTQATCWDLVEGAMGLVLPPDNAGIGLVAPLLSVPLYGRYGFNLYANQQNGTSYQQNGAAGALLFDGTTLAFQVAPPGLRGQPIPLWNTALIVTASAVTVPNSITVGRAPCTAMEVANAGYVQAAVAELEATLQAQLAAIPTPVTSFNFRTGDVQLLLDDVLRAGGAPLVDPHFGGWVTAPTPFDPCSDDQTVPTTGWVTQRLINWFAVFSFNCRTGNITLNDADITAAATAPGAQPRSVTPPYGDISNRIATTSFVSGNISDLESTIEGNLENYITTQEAALFAPINSPAFTGVPDAPTASPGSNTGQLATTAFVHAAIVAATSGVVSFNTRTGAVVLQGSDISAAGGALTTNPAFSGTPTAPTAVNGTNSTQLATTAFVMQELSVVGSGVTSFNTRSGIVTLTLADVTATTVLNNTALTGTPTAPTAAAATSTTQLATTAFVAAALTAATAGVVATFNGRAGAVTLQAADVSALGVAFLSSPPLTGTPTAPTANPGTATTQLATTQFVATAVAASGVTSFNGRGGAVTLTSADITAAGGATAAMLPVVTTLTPAMDGTAAIGASGKWADGAHVHPTDTTRAAQASLANYLPLTGGTVAGTLTISNSGAGNSLILSKSAGSGIYNVIYGVSGGANRWRMDVGDGIAESGGGNGTDFALTAFNDAGSPYGTALHLTRNNALLQVGGTWGGGWGCKSGTNGAFSGTHAFNIDFPAQHLWIDATDIGLISVTSDYRIKKDVAPLVSTWQQVKALRPVSYTHAEYHPPSEPTRQSGDVAMFPADDIVRWGFIAHELQDTLIPSAATGVKDDPVCVQSPNPWTVIATLTRALQEAMQRIEHLEAA